jgi:hypothetical protein
LPAKQVDAKCKEDDLCHVKAFGWDNNAGMFIIKRVISVQKIQAKQPSSSSTGQNEVPAKYQGDWVDQTGGPDRQGQANSYKHLIGTEYEGGLIIPGWEDQGGGLMADPVWYHHYRRDDDAYLVLINWAMPRKPGATHTPFRITDVLVIPRIEKGFGLTFDCEPPRTNVSAKVFAVVRIDIRQKWWRGVREAWKVELGTGMISPVPTKGIACLNEGFGATP